MIELDASEGLLTTTEVMRALGVRRAAILRAVAAGLLPAVQMGNHGHWRYSAKWVREHTEAGEAAGNLALDPQRGVGR